MTPSVPPADLDRLVDVFRALADPTRLRILGALAVRPHTGKELSQALSLTPPTISHHMAKLQAVDLITVTRDGQRHTYTLDASALRQLNQQTAATPPTEIPSDLSAEERERHKVLRDFFDGPRLKQIPAQRKKRVIVLQHLMHRFDPAQTYTERQVNDLLREAHEDVASLRRELVDYGFMTHPEGIYRVADQPPPRSLHVAQEITGDEGEWFRALVNRALTGDNQ